MRKVDAFEKEIIEAHESGILRSTMPSKSELKAFREAARGTSVKDRRVNIRLSSPDLRDLRARVLEEGLPYQTLIASVLHKFVAGRLVERPAGLTVRSPRTVRKRAAGLAQGRAPARRQETAGKRAHGLGMSRAGRAMPKAP